MILEILANKPGLDPGRQIAFFSPWWKQQVLRETDYGSITVAVIVIISIVVIIIPITVIVIPVSVVSEALALVGASIRAVTDATLLSLVILFQLCYAIVGLTYVAAII